MEKVCIYMYANFLPTLSYLILSYLAILFVYVSTNIVHSACVYICLQCVYTYKEIVISVKHSKLMRRTGAAGLFAKKSSNT